MRSFLSMAYVAFLVAVRLSIVNTIAITLIMTFTIGWNYGAVYNGLDLDAFPNGLAGVLCVIFASWGSDGFMMRLFKQQRLDVADHFIFSVTRYGSVRFYVKEGRDFNDC